MKVVCEYCGSYVETDENAVCPLCNASLGSSVQAEQESIEAKEEAQRQAEAEEQAQEAKDDHISEIISGVTSVATAFASGIGLSSAIDNSSERDRGKRRRPPEGMPPEKDGGFRDAPPHFDDRQGMRPSGIPGNQGGMRDFHSGHSRQGRNDGPHRHR